MRIPKNTNLGSCPASIYISLVGFSWLAIVVLIGVVDALINIFGTSAKNQLATWALIVLGLGLIVWMWFSAKALYYRRQWGRAAGLVVAILACGVGLASVQGDHPDLLLATILLVPALCLIFGLLAKTTTAWLVSGD